MRQIILLFAAVMILDPILVAAVVDNVTIGRYNVSFDIGQPLNEYNIQTAGPTEVEELSGVKRSDYTVTITGNISTLLQLQKSILFRYMTIQIMEFSEEMTRIPSNVQEQNLRKRAESDESNTNIQTSIRVIDGVEGAVAAYGIKQSPYINEYTNERKEFPPLEAYRAIYQPAFDDGQHGNLLVYIDSIYPWDEGTRQLLSTIHINKAKELSMFPIQQKRSWPS